jgi:hypothetical protein
MRIGAGREVDVEVPQQIKAVLRFSGVEKKNDARAMHLLLV